MAIVDLIIWQNMRVSYTPALGTRPAGVTSVRCRAFNHAAVRTTLNNGNVNWFTTQLPVFVPVVLPARINGPINIPGAGAPIVLRKDDVENTLVQAINRQLTLWSSANQLDLGGSNRLLWAFEVRSSFAMAFWAGIKTGAMGFGRNDQNQHLLPDWMLGIPGPSSDFRTGSVTIPAGATVTTSGTRRPVTLQKMTLRGQRNPAVINYHTYNVNAFVLKATANRASAAVGMIGQGPATGFKRIA